MQHSMFHEAGLTIWEFSLLLAAGAFLAGLLGSLTGLGGGVVIVPMLTLLFDVEMRYAIGVSLLAVIATSSGAAAAYVREGFTNVRLGLFLEMATTAGAISGAMLALGTSANAIAVIFGCVLIFSAYFSWKGHESEHVTDSPHRFAQWLKLDSTFPTPQGLESYNVQHVPAGFALMYVAGVLSGLLGIGSGAVKVLAMDRAMRLPFKVSTTTSNFMIGVTAAASAGVYLHRGYLDPGLAIPIVLGVLGGATLGAKILVRERPDQLRMIFALVIVAVALQMIYGGMRGTF
jgi:uncharacterized membrane protein YfcA